MVILVSEDIIKRELRFNEVLLQSCALKKHTRYLLFTFIYTFIISSNSCYMITVNLYFTY